MEKFFKLKENGTTVKTEVIAGITTFMTMAYILAVNPSTMTDNGNIMSSAGVFIATALAAGVGTLFMSLFANYPFALAPGMGLNAYFSYTVVLGMGVDWRIALLAVFVEGIIFILLSLTNVREAIFNAIPMNLKSAVSVGIGIFIAFIGLKGANIVVKNDATLVDLVKFNGDNFHTLGITALIAIIGTLITAFLMVKNVKGNILLGILITWVLGMLAQVCGLYVPDAANGFYSVFPDFSKGFQLGALGDVFGQVFNFGAHTQNFHIGEFIVVVFSFLFVDLFDTLGTLIGVATKADMLDENGKLPRIKGALMADACATTVGAVMGTSTVTTYVESASGVSEGGRTGLTSLVTAILFFVSVFLSPIFTAIPSFATAPALIMVGFYMMQNVVKIDFTDLLEAIPAFLAIIAMPLTYSISEGIAIGVISYTLLVLISGKAKEKKLSPLMIILTILFIANYAFL